MIRRAIAVAVMSLALFAAPAAAWDPDEDGWDWWWRPDPASEPAAVWSPDPAPAAPDPVPAWTPDPAPAWTADPVRAWTPDPAPVEVPSGLYYVTQTYVADIVTTQGPVTTYSTATVAESPGTYARVVESVGTGASSGYDGSAFNGRAHLTDGRDVAGTYYENFVPTSTGFVSVSIVFFQDDSETAAVSAPPASAPPAGSAAPPSAQPIAIILPTTEVAAAPPVSAALPAAAALPQAGPPELGSDLVGTGSPTAPTPASASSPAAPVASTPSGPPHVPVLRGGVSPQPQGDLLGSIDVLRGRRIALWPRATADGAPARVRDWHASGELVALGALSGSGEEPLVARWDAVAPPGGSWLVRLALVVDLPGGATSAIDVVVSIVVRSPALVQ